MSYPPNNPPPNYPPSGSGSPGGYGWQSNPGGPSGPGGPGGYGRPAAPGQQGISPTGGQGGYGQGRPPSYPPYQPGGPAGPSGPPVPGYNQYGPPPEKKKSHTGLIIGIIIAVVIVLGGGIAGGIYVWKSNNSGDVSRAEFEEGLKKSFVEQGGGEMLEDEQVDKMIKCITDKAYDKLSNDERRKVVKGEPFTNEVMESAATDCLEVVFEGIFKDLDDLGNSDDDEDPLGSKDNDNQGTDDSGSETTSPEENTSSAAETETEAETDSADAVGGVSLEAYEDGLRTIFEEGLELGIWTEDDIEPLIKCVAEESYDKVSEDVRASVASGRDVDNPVLFEAGATCAERLHLGAGGGE